MKLVKTLAIRGALLSCFAPCLFGAAFAQSSTTDSAPSAQRAETKALNQEVLKANQDAEAQYERNTARYQVELTQYRANQQKYEEQSARYEAAQDRYAAQRALYRRGAWPSRYEHSIIVETTELLGAPVQTSNGHKIGHVEEIALGNGRVDALRVTLDHNKGDAWIGSADLRFDVDKKAVITNLSNQDLNKMTLERY